MVAVALGHQLVADPLERAAAGTPLLGQAAKRVVVERGAVAASGQLVEEVVAERSRAVDRHRPGAVIGHVPARIEEVDRNRSSWVEDSQHPPAWPTETLSS